MSDWQDRGVFGWDLPPGVTGLEEAINPSGESEAQCPISNHCPMEDARQCERYGQCYWEEQDQFDLDEQSHNYDWV